MNLSYTQAFIELCYVPRIVFSEKAYSSMTELSLSQKSVCIRHLPTKT